MISLLYAQEGAVSQTRPQGGLVSFVPLLVIFAIFYLLLIRPQQKKAKEHKKLLNDIKRGDRVITSGGMYGVIAGLRGNVIELKIADDVKIQISRSSVSSVIDFDPRTADAQTVTEAEVVKK